MSNGDLGAIFGEAFDINKADDGLLKPGRYQVHVDAAELRNTRKGDGRYVWLEMSIVNHESRNTDKIWANINIANPNQKCVEIGIRTLAALGKAAGVDKIEDTSQLVGAVVVAHVKVKDGQNNVRTFSAVPVAQAPGHAPVPPPVQPAQQPAQVWQPPQQQQPPVQQVPSQQPPMHQTQPAPQTQPPQQGSLPWAR